MTLDKPGKQTVLIRSMGLNGGVRELNTKIKVFPNTLFVRGLGFHEREFFEVTEPAAIAEPPRVQF